MALTRAVTDFKDSVKAATTTDITLTGGAPNTVDSISLSLADSILVKAQSNPTENGLYRVTTLGTGSNGTWTRRSDFNSSSQVNAGSLIFVEQGAINGNVFYYLPGGIGTVTVGSTNLNFSNLYATIQTQIDDSIIASILPTYTGNVSASNVNASTGIYSSNYYFANGAPFTSSNYGNTEVSSYLTTYNGNLTAGNLTVSSTANVGNLITSGGVFWANGSTYSSGGGGGGGITYTASTSAPASPTAGDQWYETDTDTLFTYVNDGTTTFWLDITTGATSVSNTAGYIVTTNTDPSTSTTTGALQVAGGAGIVGNLNVGNTLTVTGNILPSANVTYNLGSSTQRFNNLWLAGSTIYMGSITLKDNSGSFSVYDHTGNNPVAVEVAAVNNTPIGNATPHTGAFTNLTAGNLTVSSTANVGNLITSGGVFWANGSAFSSSSGGSSGGISIARAYFMAGG